MKATSKIDDFVVGNIFNDIHLPAFCKKEPSGFDKYKWITQNKRIIPIKAFHDNHLLNTYRMLIRTVEYARDLSKHMLLTRPMEQVIRQCRYHIHFIGHEIYLRQNKKLETDETLGKLS